MNIIWLGHSGFRIEIGNQVLLVDPWLRGNPMFDETRFREATKGATHILITHAHGDHTGQVIDISNQQSAPIVGIYDLMGFYETKFGSKVVGFNKGGTVMLGDVAVTMVNATHSSTASDNGAVIPAGSEAGFMIAGEGHVIYVSGDTDIMADMEWMGDLHKPDIGILCAGGHFTMDMARAAYAAKRYFNFKTVIPCHYRTFPLLEQSAATLIKELPSVNVIEPEVMRPIKF